MYGPWSWFRIPPQASWDGAEGTAPAVFTTVTGDGATENQVWLKTGHLGKNAVLASQPQGQRSSVVA